MSKSKRKIVGVFFFSLGIGIMVLYAVYIGQFSGSPIGIYQIQEFDGDFVSLGFFISSEGKSVKQVAGPIALTPAMSPIRALLRIDQTGLPLGLKKLHSHMVLAHENNGPVWEGKYIHDVDANKSTMRAAHKAFSIHESGNYYLSARFEDKRNLGSIISKATVSLRRNVAKINMRIMLALGALALTGFLLMLSGVGKKE